MCLLFLIISSTVVTILAHFLCIALATQIREKLMRNTALRVDGFASNHCFVTIATAIYRWNYVHILKYLFSIGMLSSSGVDIHEAIYETELANSKSRIFLEKRIVAQVVKIFDIISETRSSIRLTISLVSIQSKMNPIHTLES
jgi:hypothetical protein